MMKNKQKPKAEESRVTKKTSAIIENIKASPFKKISATVGFIAVVIGLIAGSIGLVRQYLAAREFNREIAMYIEVGDRFVEQYKLNEGIAEYEKALEKEKDNIEAHRKIITAMRIKYEVADKPIPKVEDVQSRIYQLQALHPKLKNDVRLMIDEARLIRYNYAPNTDQFKRARQLMERAYEISPKDPEVLAQLGLLRALDSPLGQTEGLDLLGRAVDLMPDEYRYHFYFARALMRARDYNKAANEYYAALQLTTDDNIKMRSSREWIITRLINLLWFVFHQEGALTPTLDLSFAERLQVLELLGVNYLFLPGIDHDRALYRELQSSYFASLYDTLGNHIKANSIMTEALDDLYDSFHGGITGLYNLDDELQTWFLGPYTSGARFKSNSLYHEWLCWQKLVKLHIKIMNNLQTAPPKLIEAHRLLKAMKSYNYSKVKSSYTFWAMTMFKIKWCWDAKNEYMQMVEYPYFSEDLQLRLKENELTVWDNIDRDSQYFQDGVRKGDRLFEAANQPIKCWVDINRILYPFKSGDEIPIKFQRGNKVIESVLKVSTDDPCNG